MKKDTKLKPCTYRVRAEAKSLVNTLKHGHLIKMTRIENENEDTSLFLVWQRKKPLCIKQMTKRLGFLTASGPKNRPPDYVRIYVQKEECFIRRGQEFKSAPGPMGDTRGQTELEWPLYLYKYCMHCKHMYLHILGTGLKRKL